MSSLCPQLWLPIPRWRHWFIEVSLPLQLRSSNQIWPVPEPNLATRWAGDNPSIRQMTFASLRSKPSSQTVPHLPRTNTSIRPSAEFLPFTRRTLETKQMQKHFNFNNCRLEAYPFLKERISKTIHWRATLSFLKQPNFCTFC